MKSIASLLCATVFLLSPVLVAAHDGHDEIEVLFGTVKNVEDKTFELETLDQATLQRKTVSILLDAKTKFLLGKKRVETLELAAGQRIESTVRSEHTQEGSTRFRALQIKVSEPKKPTSTSSAR